MEFQPQTGGEPFNVHARSGLQAGQRAAKGRPAGRGGRWAKRTLDVVVAGPALVALSPLLVLIGLLIVVDTGRPVLYRQVRYGRNRVPFRVWKFRTLSPEASLQPFRQVTARDERITRIGRFLRRINFDELPQLLNVLGGSMSLVGPRPHPVELDEHFEPLIAHYAQRFTVKPGMTGWAQVNGCRGETDTIAKMEQRIARDLQYLSRRSIAFDLRILALTLLSARSYRNAR